MNVVYHANATQLSVALNVNRNDTQLTIEDDGFGFDPNREYPGHWGVGGMRERAQLIGGDLAIRSEPGRGTTIQLTIAEK